MHSSVRSVCNLWHHSKKSIFFALGVILGIFISWGWQYVNQYFNYQDLDLVIKFISGTGVIVAGIFVYIKWQDEKTRRLYERRLQEIYAPLANLLLKQESVRNYLESEGHKNISREEHPILKTLDREPPVALKKEDFLNEFTKLNMGLVSPSLLAVASEYEFMLPYETRIWHDFRNKKKQWALFSTLPPEKEFPGYSEAEEVSKKTQIIEKKFIDEIVKGYNECIFILDLDAQRINLNKKDFWEKTS